MSGKQKYHTVKLADRVNMKKKTAYEKVIRHSRLFYVSKTYALVTTAHYS